MNRFALLLSTAVLGPILVHAPAAQAQAATCSAPKPGNEAADVHVPGKRAGAPAPALADPTPSLQAETLECTRQAAARYAQIAADGGWPQVPAGLSHRSKGKALEVLRQRLAKEGDLPDAAATDGSWTEDLTQALRAFQTRAGLEATGRLDETTRVALNVPADVRARELNASADRLAGLKVTFGGRQIVANIPSATVEAVEDGKVIRRYVAVAGDREHQSPTITASIKSVTINPTWTIPRSIVESEVLPKIRKSPKYLKVAQIQILNRKGREIDPTRIDWSDEDGEGLTFRQDPGAKNSLGHIRIDMPNRESVYLHDTPERQKFEQDYRFLSHGCLRVDSIVDLASWLLEGSAKDAWTPERITSTIKDEDTKRVELKKAVPVAWTYLTAWSDASGTIHYRPDVYDMDGANDVPQPKSAKAARTARR